MGVSKNRGTPKSSVLIGFSIINHPFWGSTIFGNIHIFCLSFIHVAIPFCKLHGALLEEDGLVGLAQAKSRGAKATVFFFGGKGREGGTGV